MEKEILVTGDDRETWTDEVNAYLNDGWKVRDHTLQMSVAMAPTPPGSYGTYHSITHYAIILYKW